MNRPLIPGEIAYIRVRVVQKVNDKQFGDYVVEPVTKFQQQTRPGMYTYMNRNEIITLDEARRIAK